MHAKGAEGSSGGEAAVEGGQAAVPTHHLSAQAPGERDASGAAKAGKAKGAGKGKAALVPVPDGSAVDKEEEDLLGLLTAEYARKGARDPAAAAREAMGGDSGAGSAAAAAASSDHRGAGQQSTAGPASASGKVMKDSEAIGNGVSRGGIVHEALTGPHAGHPGSVHPSNVLLTLPGAEHQNFNDFAVIMRPMFRLMKLIGPAEPVKTLRTIADLTTAFMDQATATATATATVKGSASGQGSRAAPGSKGAASSFSFVFPPSVDAKRDVSVSAWTVAQATEAERAE